MKYIIGVDSGGTSTKAAAYDLEGQLLKETKTGFGNLLNNADEALYNIRKAITDIFDDLGESNCQMVVLGVAGVDSGGFREILQEDLDHFQPEVVLLNDAWLAHYALLNGANGALVISGTGSIVIGRNEEVEDRVGGYGNLLGDEGSGYDIARKMIKSTLNAQDESREFSELEEKVLAFGDFDSVTDIVKFVYASSKDKIAELSMVAVELAEEGNTEAIQIFEEAGQDLGKQVNLLLAKLKLEEDPKVAVTGSVLLQNDWVFASFEETVKEDYPTCLIVREDKSNTIGGYYYYMNR